MIRHLFTKNAISEVIRLKYPRAEESTHLMEGIFQRYCVLESDIELGQLSYSAKNYEMLHSLRLKLRNYNIAAQAAEKHWTDPDCPMRTKIADLDDILNRSKKITDGFINFAESRGLHIVYFAASKYIRNYYEKRIPEWEKENKINYSIEFPQGKETDYITMERTSILKISRTS